MAPGQPVGGRVASGRAASIRRVLSVFAWLAGIGVPAVIGAKADLASVQSPELPVIRTASEDIAPGVRGMLAAVRPQDGCTYSWTIVGGAIDSGVSTNQISFSAGTGSSLTLRCVVTNAAGLSASGSLTLFVPGGGLSPMPATTVGGTVQGLTAGPLVLQNNQGNNLIVTANGPFTFGVPVASGSPYSVTVLSQPEGQACTVTKGSGLVGQGNVADFAIACSPSISYPIAPPSVTLGGRVVASLVRPLTEVPSTETLYMLRNAFVADLDGDGYPEAILGPTTYPNQIAQPIIVVGARAGLSLPADSMFVGGVPLTQHPNQMFTIDLNGDGLPDLVIGNAGLDHPPWTGGPIAVALNMGGGKFRNVSALLPASMVATRSYAVAAGDLHKDRKIEIILPDGYAPGNGTLSESLRWNGTGFDEDPSWISKTIWAFTGGCNDASWLGATDLDGDGFQDVIVAGNFTRPNLRVLYGSATGFQLFDFTPLPEGTWGHTPSRYWNLPGNPSSQGAELDRVVIADFNNDGLPDIFALAVNGTYYQPGVFADQSYPGYQDLFQNGGTAYSKLGLQVVLNRGGRVFTDVSSESSVIDLGRRYYVAAFAADLNNDGATDVVALYYTMAYGSQLDFRWGTTFFLNDGTGAFHVVDAGLLMPELMTTGPAQPGSFLPTMVSRNGMEGVLVPNGATNPSTAKDFLIEKVVTARSIGTGPGLADPAVLGAPGFNEYYYLHTHPDVAASVRAGSFSSGLDHYLKAGRAAGYQAFARHTVAWGGIAGAPVALYGGNTYRCGMGGDDVRVTGGSNIIYSGPGNDVLSGGVGSDEVVYSGPRSRYKITANPDGSTTVADSLPGGDGIDRITGNFQLRFADSGVPARPPRSPRPLGPRR